MGLGKTVISLMFLHELKLVEGFKKCLIVAPARVAESVWQEEIKKWGFNFKVSEILGTPKQRNKALNKLGAEIFIISASNFYWFCTSKPEVNFDIIIIDEFSLFRNPKSLKFKALKYLRPNLKRLIGLTGTPCPKSIYDIWGLIRLLDQGQRLYRTQKEFQKEYFNPGLMINHVVCNWVPRKGATQKIEDKIKDICISMKAIDHLDLPDFIHQDVFTVMDSKIEKMYKELKKEFLLQFETGDIDAKSAGVLVNKLQQFVNGNCYLDTNKIQHIHSIKIDMLKELIDQTQDNILIFYNYNSDRDMIVKSIKDSGLLDIKKWNARKQKIALLHPGSGGHGLNLQYGGSTMIWFGPTWSLELYEQAKARIFRMGQKYMVRNYVIIMRNSIDERIMSMLGNKKIIQDGLIEGLKKEIGL